MEDPAKPLADVTTKFLVLNQKAFSTVTKKIYSISLVSDFGITLPWRLLLYKRFIFMEFSPETQMSISFKQKDTATHTSHIERQETLL